MIHRDNCDSRMSTGKITVLYMNDLSEVQGQTEPYYVLQHLANQYDVHLLSPTDPEIDGVLYHSIPNSDLIPALIWHNILIFPILLFKISMIDSDVLYTYGKFPVASLLISTVCETRWVTDFRTAPTDQGYEFAVLKQQTSLLRGFYLWTWDLIYKITLPSADHVITLSTELIERLHNEYQVPPENLTMVPLGVDSEAFDYNRFEQQESTRTRYVYLGSIARFRGLQTCFKAVANDEGLQDDVELHLIGTGPDDDIMKLRQKTTELGIESMITWHGYVGHEQVPSLLAEMDIALSPLPPHDSFEVSSPAKLYEYLSMGLPIVCSDITPHQDTLTESHTGWFFEPSSSGSAAEAMRDAKEAIQMDKTGVQSRTRKVALRNDWSERISRIEPAIFPDNE